MSRSKFDSFVRRSTVLRVSRALLVGLAVVAHLAPAGRASGQTWELVFEDEFDQGAMLDMADWNYSTGGDGWGNNEVQFYTDRAENARLENGLLVIEPRLESFGGRSYTSARVNTRGKHDLTYGRVEVRARMPAGRGTWSAIWLLYTDTNYGNGSWPDNGEIDIMEHVGFENDRVHATIHTDAYNAKDGTQIGSSRALSTAVDSFHVYSVEWQPNQLRVAVDGVDMFVYNRPSDNWKRWPFDQAFHLILNTAIGGDWGGLQGIDDSAFPQQFEIDYVRIYREVDPEPVVALEGLAEPASYQVGDTLRASVLASDGDGAVARVELLQGDGVVAESGTSPGEFAVMDLAPGCYEVSARAEDDAGWSSVTESVSVTVGSECVQAPYLMRYARLPGVVEAENYDLGGPGVAYSDLDPVNVGSRYRINEGVDIEPTDDSGGGYNVTGINNREWIEYSVSADSAGLYAATVRVASAIGGSFELLVDDVAQAGTINVNPTGGLQSWRNAGTTVTLAEGPQVVRYRARSNGLNVNRITFTYLGPTGVDEDSNDTDRANKSIEIRDIYPNPAADELMLTLATGISGSPYVELFDVAGRVIKAVQGGSNSSVTPVLRVDVSDLPAGMYLLRVSVDGHAAARPFLVAR